MTHQFAPSLGTTVAWTEETFVDSEQACIDLCADRAGFMRYKDIMNHIPMNIKLHIRHHESTAHIRGFADLFIDLDNKTCTQRLRELVKAYFYDNPPLRGHLSSSFTSLLVQIVVSLEKITRTTAI